MKKYISLTFLILFSLSSHAQWANGAWQRLFLLSKDKYAHQYGLQPLVFHIDTLNPQKKTAFYGNWDKARLYDAQGNYTTISNAPNAMFADGTSAGEIKFNPDYTASTIFNHTFVDNVEYIGIRKDEYYGDANGFNAINYLKNGKYIDETSIKFDADAYIYPIKDQKFLIVGNFYYGWDKDGKKTLKGFAIWDKKNGTLSRTNRTTEQIDKVRTSNKDNTIVALMDANYSNMKIFWYENGLCMDSLYPAISGINGDARIRDVFVIDKYNMYVAWQDLWSNQSKLLKLDYANKKWLTVATMDDKISSISGDYADNIFVSGVYQKINGVTVAGGVSVYSISKNTFTDLPQIYVDYNLVNLFYVGGVLYMVSDYELGDKKETIYKFVLGPPPIPVELQSFTAKSTSAGVKLNWSTAQETGSDRFEIEHSVDGTNFAKIGSVKAAGNSAIQSNYEYLDLTADAGIHFYRLKMIDKDGQFKYSSIVKIEQSANQKPSGIYPNPASSEIWVQLSSGDNSVQVYNAADQLVYRKKIKQSSPAKKRIDISGWKNGIYLMVIENGASVEKLKLVKN